MLSKRFLLAAIATTALAQNEAYAQCGGQNWTGSKSCVSGYACKYSNAWYSQCLPSSGSGGSGNSRPTTTKAAAAPTSAPTSSSGSSGSSSSGSGGKYQASFTEYGSGDQNGSGNCNTATTACGFYTSPGYSAAVSQNEFGVGPVCSPFMTATAQTLMHSIGCRRWPSLRHLLETHRRDRQQRRHRLQRRQ